MPLTEQGKADIEALGGQLYVTNVNNEVWLRPGQYAKLVAVLEASIKLADWMTDAGPEYLMDHDYMRWRKAIEEAR